MGAARGSVIWCGSMKSPLLVLLLAAVACAEAPREWLVAGPLKGRGRGFLAADAAAEMMFGGEAPRYPKKGDRLGGLEWVAMTETGEGAIEGEALAPGVAYTVVPSESERVVLVSCPGAGTVYVNGVAFVGDVYASGVDGVPVLLRKGENHVVCRAARGRLSLEMSDPPAPVFLMDADVTLPSRVGGENQGAWGAAVLVNATAEWVRDATISYGRVTAPLAPLAPLAVTKVPFLVGKGDSVTVTVKRGADAHARTWALHAPEKTTAFRRTFRSKIDRSVQYYGVQPPANFDRSRRYALLLSLHGAGVEGGGQAAAYAPFDWCAVVCPTNRRPYGFNWEEWGRLDGLEVLERGIDDFKVDESRILLSGHSMGGHGAWHFAVTYPDRWACVAPSAGWISFWTYPFERRDAPPDYERLFRASVSPSDTLGLARNLAGLPIYVLHGGADDVVKPEQAEWMIEALKPFHKDWRYTKVEGKPHWWNADGPGVDCLTLPDMTDWMQRQRRPESLASWEFRTFSPAVSSSCRGFEILAQARPYALTRVRAWVDEFGARFFETENAVHVRVRSPRSFTLDGQPLQAGEFHRGADGRWAAGAPAGLRKTPSLQGAFSQAFHTPFLFVVPSAGDPAEIADCVARARLDASIWWYRGNGRAPVVADADVTEKHWKDFNLVLLGSADSNACWKKIADRLPFRAAPGAITIRGDVLKGDLALAAVYPNPDAPGKLVAVIGASGPAGRRAWNAFTWWHPDTGAPDVACWGADVHGAWTDAIRAIGYFGADWKPQEGMWEVRK